MIYHRPPTICHRSPQPSAERYRAAGRIPANSSTSINGTSMQTVDVQFHDAMGSGVLPTLPAEIYADRFERCTELMAERSLAVLVVDSAAMPFARCERARYFATYVQPYWNSQ